MSPAQRPLRVTSHVGRDLLQTARLFQQPRNVVWEYVANSLQYVDPGVTPHVEIWLLGKGNERKLIISDNGAGMGYPDLVHFFTMHGENRERRAGRAGRGLNGSGKSAAFGIADVLGITTRRSGRRWKIQLCKADIAAMRDGQDVPLTVLEEDVPTDEPNGTQIEIARLQVAVNPREIAAYVERHLATYPAEVEVRIDGHRCRYVAPVSVETLQEQPPEELAAILGPDVVLILQVAQEPLEKDRRGVAVCSNGVMHEQTLCGLEGRPMASYLFGRIEVPRLDQQAESPVSPFDPGRRQQLNQENEIVRAIYAFVGPRLEVLRQRLEQQARQAKRDEIARRLARRGGEIARLLNSDFHDFHERVAVTVHG